MIDKLVRRLFCARKGHRTRRKVRLVGHEMMIYSERCGRCHEYLCSTWETLPPAVVDAIGLGPPRVLKDEYVNPFYCGKRFIFPWQ